MPKGRGYSVAKGTGGLTGRVAETSRVADGRSASRSRAFVAARGQGGGAAGSAGESKLGVGSGSVGVGGGRSGVQQPG